MGLKKRGAKTEPFDFYNFIAGHTDRNYVILSKSVAIITASFPVKVKASLYYGVNNLDNVIVDNNYSRFKKFILYGLNVDTEYIYRMVVEDEKGNVYFSNVQSFKTGKDVDIYLFVDNVSFEFFKVNFSTLNVSQPVEGYSIEYDFSQNYYLDKPETLFNFEGVNFVFSSFNVDDIYRSNVNFTGIGLNDLKAFGSSTTNESGFPTAEHYIVQIDGVGTPNTFRWSRDGGNSWEATNIQITGSWQRLVSAISTSIYIKFDNIIGHTLGDSWDWWHYPAQGIVYSYNII